MRRSLIEERERESYRELSINEIRVNAATDLPLSLILGWLSLSLSFWLLVSSLFWLARFSRRLSLAHECDSFILFFVKVQALETDRPTLRAQKPLASGLIGLISGTSQLVAHGPDRDGRAIFIGSLSLAWLWHINWVALFWFGSLC